jgi:cbb3-type cytochrome oxidase maturation protein
MGMLFIFTGLGLVLFTAAVAALIWSIRTGQLDDLETPALRMLNDDAAPREPSRTGALQNAADPACSNAAAGDTDVPTPPPTTP